MTRILFAGAASFALLAACSQQPGNSEPVNAAQDAVSAPVGQMSAATMGANTVGGFIPAMAMSDMYEIKAGEIAARRSKNAEVKALAAMLIADHTASSAKLKGLAPAAAPDVAIPTALDERRQGMLDNLTSASDADFDRVFLTQQEAAHNEALTLLNGFKDNTDAPPLAALAGEVIPKVTMHRDHAQDLLAKM